MRKWDLTCRPQKDKRDMLTQPERALKVSNGIKAKLFFISARVNSVMIFSRVILYQVLVRESALGYHRSKQTLYAVLLSLECHKRNHLQRTCGNKVCWFQDHGYHLFPGWELAFAVASQFMTTGLLGFRNKTTWNEVSPSSEYEAFKLATL